MAWPNFSVSTITISLLEQMDTISLTIWGDGFWTIFQAILRNFLGLRPLLWNLWWILHRCFWPSAIYFQKKHILFSTPRYSTLKESILRNHGGGQKPPPWGWPKPPVWGLWKQNPETSYEKNVSNRYESLDRCFWPSPIRCFYHPFS